MSATRPAALMAKGRALHAAGSLDAALSAFRAAAAADPELATPQIMIALILLDQGKHKDALTAADGALQLAPTSDAALRARAVALSGLKRLSKGKKAAAEAIRANPMQAANHRVQGMILVQCRQYAKAETAYRHALGLSPLDTLTLVGLGMLLAYRGRMAEADELAARCKGSAADHIAVLVFRGHLALLKGQVEEARELALWALSRNAVYQPAITLLFSVHARRSPVLGLWWRVVARIDRYPRYPLIAVVVGSASLVCVPLAYLGFDPDVANRTVKDLLLVFVGYLLASQLIFRARIRRELRQVRLKRSF